MDDVSAFPGIQFTRKNNTIELLQKGLIDRIVATTGMEDYNSEATPAQPRPLEKDVNRKPFLEPWKYASVVGMLLYLSGNSRPDIAFAVNQAACFTQNPKASHAAAVKRIIQYLSGTKHRNLTFKPTTDWKLDCYVDAPTFVDYGDPRIRMTQWLRSHEVVTSSRLLYVLLYGVKLLFLKEHVRTDDNPKGETSIQKIETTDQLADIFSKGLAQAKFDPLRDKIMAWHL